MKTIYKYVYTDGMLLELPANARVLHFGRDPQDDYCLWVELSPTELTIFPRHYYTFGTGHQVPESARYIASYVDKPFVWHIYEVQ
jgi:hypothetical protein